MSRRDSRLAAPVLQFGMPAHTLDALLRSVAKGELAPAYYLHGPEDVLKDLDPEERINVVVVMVAQIERRLAAAVPGRPVRPILYTANTWREHLLRASAGVCPSSK